MAPYERRPLRDTAIALQPLGTGLEFGAGSGAGREARGQRSATAARCRADVEPVLDEELCLIGTGSADPAGR
ncbi:hypothetical protein [Streptomyces sp. NPDC058572]|uniref:hypothetical protein n=1 Tax=Streptomyces sp. NPDC058572 TaxID=3346546 RepID=UPI003661E7E2